MNVVEQFIVEIYSKEVIPTPYFSSGEWVKVKMKCDCCGGEYITTNYYPKKEWEEIKEKGYYMG